MELHYLRNINGREVAFVVLKGRTSLFAVECKLSEREVSPAIEDYAARTKIPVFLSGSYRRCRLREAIRREKIRILPLWKMGDELSLV